MKKISLCVVLAMVFSVMSVVLVAQESEPSEIVGYVAYDIMPGVGEAEGRTANKIAIPLDGGWETTTDLGRAYPEITTILRWFPEGQSTVGSAPPDDAWHPEDERIWEGEFELIPGQAYQVIIAEDEEPFTLYSVGELPEPVHYDIVLGEGAAEGRNINWIMVPLNRSDLNNTTALARDMAIASTIFRWVPEGQSTVGSAPPDEDWHPGDERAWEGEFETPIGMPLRIVATEATVWPPRDDRADDESRRRSRAIGRLR